MPLQPSTGAPALRFIVADWGTTRFRGYLIENEAIRDQVLSKEGVSAVHKGQHRDVFLRQCRHWLKAEPDAPVLLVGMVGSREGWVEAPYATCPAGRPPLLRDHPGRTGARGPLRPRPQALWHQGRDQGAA